MQYMKLDDMQREELLASLAQMKQFLAGTFQSLSAEETVKAGPDGAFSPVEQVWHLADLEREGFGRRIEKLSSENDPYLPDFDGDAVAQERNYRSLSLAEGLKVFGEARDANLEKLRSLPAAAWFRSGFQQGTGKVALCDMPVFMQQHDRAHIAEILAWKAFTVRGL